MCPRFIIGSELQRDAVCAGIWTRLRCQLRGRASGFHLWEYIDYHALKRGDPGHSLLDFLDQDIKLLVQAQADLRSVADTPIGGDVVLDDVARFMPAAWKEDGLTGPGWWIYSPDEAEELEAMAGETIRRVGTIVQADG